MSEILSVNVIARVSCVEWKIDGVCVCVCVLSMENPISSNNTHTANRMSEKCSTYLSSYIERFTSVSLQFQANVEQCKISTLTREQIEIETNRDENLFVGIHLLSLDRRHYILIVESMF